MKTEAFSLVEIIIVVSIIGVLFAATSFGYDRVLKNSRDTKRRLDVAEIASAIEEYEKDNGQYPNSLSDLKNPPTYLNPIPEDPVADGTRAYTYEVNADKSSYSISTQLELSESYFVITPQGKQTTDTMVTPHPSLIPNDDPVYPSTQPTITTQPTPTVIYPSWAF